MKNCGACGKSQKNRPSIFRNEDWCSDNCRKILQPEWAKLKVKI